MLGYYNANTLDGGFTVSHTATEKGEVTVRDVDQLSG